MRTHETPESEDPELCELIHRMTPRVRAFLRHRGCPPHLVDDVVQDTWRRFIVSRRSPGFDASGKQESYVLRIAVNLLRDHFKQRSRRGATSELVDEPRAREEQRNGIVEELIERVEATLDPLARDVLECFLRGTTKRTEIASVLGVPPGPVARRWTKILELGKGLTKQREGSCR